jgi:hypothetical protein
MENNTKLFTIDDVLEQVQVLNKSLIAPYVNTTYSTLGGVSNISIMISISLDSKEKWAGGILQNSRYAMFHLANNGRLEMFSGNTPKKMRRSMVSSIEEAIKKINKYLMSPEYYEEGGNIEDKQIKYPSASESGFTLNTLVPASMYNELRLFNDFLRTFIATQYNMTVVQYVAQKLHYKSVDDLFYSDEVDELGKRKGRFSVEQIDAIAIAIYNHEINNKSIIIADQTGVGKGRTAAGLIRYVIKELQTLPIFVTEKKHLIIDIYRDLIDIGFDANIPEIRRTFEKINKDEYTKQEIISLIKKDYAENEDFRVDFELPNSSDDDDDGKNKEKQSESSEDNWFTKSKFKAFPKRKKMVKGKPVNIFKDDEDFEKYEDLYDKLIFEYEQHLLEEGYEKAIDEVVSKDEIERLEKEAEAKGKMRVVPFVPSLIDIVAETNDKKSLNVIYKKMDVDDMKQIMGFRKNEKGKLVYNYVNPPLKEINLPAKYKVIVAPYSQMGIVRTKDDAGKEAEHYKFTFFKKAIKNVTQDGQEKPAVLILDEAHNAAGESQTFEAFSTYIEYARMTTYLSATFAKRPDNMPFFAKGTSLRESGLSNREMKDVFKKGDIALQEAVSAELTRNGQILRREKQIQGKTDYFYVYDDEKQYNGRYLGKQQRVRLDNIAEMFDKMDNSAKIDTIMKFQVKVRQVIDEELQSLPRRENNNDRLEGSRDEIEKARTIKALTFNLFNYFLIGNKIDQLEYAMMDKMTNGRKLVITIANTLEAALKDMPKTFLTDKDTDKYKVGETIENDFKLYLAYLLFYTMKIKIVKEVVDDITKEVTTISETVCVFDSNHSFAKTMVNRLWNDYNLLLSAILSTKTYIPIAPIDVIKDKIDGFVDADGYKHSIEEITGRSLKLTFKNKVDENGNQINEKDYSFGKIEKREKKKTSEIVRDFNSNVIDHLIINKSGATGISMHPRPVGQAQIVYNTSMVDEVDENGNTKQIEVGFPLKLENKKEVKKRCMLVLQMELDINSEIQKLGRISRTGQVYRPEYTYIVSSIPSESRLTAMMEKKLRSLSANVSSNQEQASDLFASDDFFSKVAVVPFIDTLMSLKIQVQFKGMITKDTIKDFTKTLYFSNFETQRDFYNEFAQRLRSTVETLISLGQYTGKMTVKDYKSVEKAKYPFFIGDESAETSFGRHASIIKIDADVPVIKTTEIDINQEIDLSIKSERRYGYTHRKYDNLDNLKEDVSSIYTSYANSKIEEEESVIYNKKAEIHYYKTAIEEASKELKIYVENSEDIISLIEKIKSNEEEFLEFKNIQQNLPSREDLDKNIKSNLVPEKVISLLYKIKDADENYKKIDEEIKKAIVDEDYDTAKKLKPTKDKYIEELNKPKEDLNKYEKEMLEKIDGLKNELNKYESVLKNVSDIQSITKEFVEKEIIKIENRISRNEKEVDENLEKIKGYEKNIKYYKELLEKTLFMVNSIGGVFDYVNYIEEIQEIEKEDGVGNEITGYTYIVGESEKCVVLGVYMKDDNFTAGNIELKIISLSGSVPAIPFSKIFPNLSDKEMSLNKKPTYTFSKVNDTYVKYWDNEVLKKSSSTRREERWVVSGNLLRGFKGVVDSGYLPTIIKYTTIDRKLKIGVEIKNVEHPISKRTVYSDIESLFDKDGQYVILFDGNIKNFSSFIQGYLYDQYVGRFYNAHRTGDYEKDLYEGEAYEYYIFQIATSSKGEGQDNLSFIYVEPHYSLLDYSNGLKNALEIGRMEDVSEMSEEEFISKLKVEIVSREYVFTDYLARCLEAKNHKDYRYEAERIRPFANSSVFSSTNFNCGKAALGLYKNVIPTNKEQIIEITRSNNGDLKGAFNKISNINFEQLLDCIDLMTTLGGKPTFGVHHKYYEKYANEYMFEDNLEEKLITTDNLPTDAENEIYKMTEQLIQLL